jgi:hypothetical protein
VVRAAAQKGAPDLPHSQTPKQSLPVASTPPPERPPLPIPAARSSPAN